MGYHGYIMPIPSPDDTDRTYYQPCRAEVFKAEKLVRKYLDTCYNLNPERYNYQTSFPFHDCLYFKKNRRSYFRQYFAFIDKSTHHKYIYMLCISPRMLRYYRLKKEWPHDFNGMNLQFHIYVDFDTGQVQLKNARV